MSKDEQTVKAIAGLLAKLHVEKAEYIKTTENKIAALEITYEALTGEKPPKHETNGHKKEPAPTKTRRRGMRIDRQSAQKTYEFLKERGDKATTVKMVARKFGISPEAASQRLLKLYKEGQAVRVSLGEYVDANVVNKTAAKAPEA